MTERKLETETTLIDLALGRLDDQQTDEIQRQLDNDADLRAHYSDIKSVLDAVGLCPAPEPPSNLVASTMDHIRQQRQTNALLAREGLTQGRRMSTFSMRELVASVAVLVMLASILVPAFRHADQMAGNSQCAAQMGRISSAMTAYSAENDGYLPAASSLNARWLPVSSETSTSNSANLFKLVSGRFVGPAAFQCPSVSGSGGPGTFVISSSMVDFPRSEFVSYSYQHSLNPRSMRLSNGPMLDVADSMAILADSTPLFHDGRFLRERVRALASDNHNGTGQNVLYADGHVAWADTANAGVMGNNIYQAEGILDYKGDEKPVSPIDSFLLPAYVTKSRL